MALSALSGAMRRRVPNYALELSVRGGSGVALHFGGIASAAAAVLAAARNSTRSR